MTRPIDQFEKILACVALALIVAWIASLIADVVAVQREASIDPALRVPGVVVVDDAAGMQRAIGEAVRRRGR